MFVKHRLTLVCVCVLSPVPIEILGLLEEYHLYIEAMEEMREEMRAEMGPPNPMQKGLNTFQWELLQQWHR